MGENIFTICKCILYICFKRLRMLDNLCICLHEKGGGGGGGGGGSFG